MPSLKEQAKNMYIRASVTEKNRPQYNFLIQFPSKVSINTLWELIFKATESTSKPAVDRLKVIRENSGTTYTYGPSVRDLLDHHGHTIRSSGDKETIQYNVDNCLCQTLYPKYVDHSVGHVRTMDTAVLPIPLNYMAKMGLNFRPKFKATKFQVVRRCELWAKQVIGRLRHKSVRENQDLILRQFCKGLSRVITQCGGCSYSKLKSTATTVTEHLVITSTDKVTHTASIECRHWYVWVCLQRLLSDAFKPIAFPNCDFSDYAHLTPWATELDYEFQPAILFGTAKQHKRMKDPLAYRWITSACSWISTPLSNEAVRVLTTLWHKACVDCMALSRLTGGKYFWSIDSLDTVPLNIDTTVQRLLRQPAAFDLEKCFESIPLYDGPHALMTRVRLFLDLVWCENKFLCSSSIPWKADAPSKGCDWQSTRSGISYDAEQVAELVAVVISLAVVTVGDTAAQQQLGIPMGFSISVLLLNIYMFTYEFEFVSRLANHRPDLLVHTWEIFRYVDDLGNFSDLDLRQYLQSLDSEPVDWDWIYPLAPWGPLSITDQTSREPDSTTVIYLNLEFTLSEGWLSYSWYDKAQTYSEQIPLCVYTHWGSNITNKCKIGIIYSQTRSVMLANSSKSNCEDGLRHLANKLISIGYPQHLISERIQSAYDQLIAHLPVPYSNTLEQ